MLKQWWLLTVSSETRELRHKSSFSSGLYGSGHGDRSTEHSWFIPLRKWLARLFSFTKDDKITVRDMVLSKDRIMEFHLLQRV
jgi:hypothetical protein